MNGTRLLGAALEPLEDYRQRGDANVAPLHRAGAAVPDRRLRPARTRRPAGLDGEAPRVPSQARRLARALLALAAGVLAAHPPRRAGAARLGRRVRPRLPVADAVRARARPDEAVRDLHGQHLHADGAVLPRLGSARQAGGTRVARARAGHVPQRARGLRDERVGVRGDRERLRLRPRARRRGRRRGELRGDGRREQGLRAADRALRREQVRAQGGADAPAGLGDRPPPASRRDALDRRSRPPRARRRTCRQWSGSAT